MTTQPTVVDVQELLDRLRGIDTRLDALERLLMPSTAVSGHTIGQRLKAAAADVVVTPPTFTSTTQEPA
jgi:hypothetical protein